MLKSATKKHNYLRKSNHFQEDILLEYCVKKVRLLHMILIKTVFSFFPINENETTDYVHRAKIHETLQT